MDTKELIQKYNIRANKNFGQNFLHRQDIIDLIASSAKGTPFAIEIGAGLGVLSRTLCDFFEKVVTIEIDRSLSDVTKETLSDVSNHLLIYQNFLKTDINKLSSEIFAEGDITVVGNLPYNITGDIISKLLKNHSFLTKAVVMIQKEAAEKLAATPKDDGYRAISVLTQYFCDIETVIDVSADCFIPAPHVTSRVIKLSFKKNLPLPIDKESDFCMFVNNVFSQRRKVLTSLFKNPDMKQKAVNVLESMGFSDKARGEQFTPNQFTEFYQNMFM